MDIHALFKPTYREARKQFVELAGSAGGALETFPHPEAGPDGESLSLDVASWGVSASETLVVVSCGTHGIEGFAGSGVQATLLRDGITRRLPKGVGLVMVHAVNPYGFAWRRRVNEDNVDLNRNFIDHTASHPVNDRYAELADLITPSLWNDQTLAAIQEGLRDYAMKEGPAALQAALSGGQYQFADGIFFGGRVPTWSNQRVREIARSHLSKASRVFMVDIHTGLGDYGSAECIVEYPPEEDRAAVATEIWGGRVKNTLAGESVSAAVSGSIVSGLGEELSGQLVGTGLEYGTVPVAQVMVALLADQWLHNHGDPRSAQGVDIKRQMYEAFFGDTDEWRESVVEIGRDVVGAVLDYLS